MNTLLKRLFSLLMCMCLVFGMIPGVAFAAETEEMVTSGSCGDNAFWNYDPDTMTLTITGHGEMTAWKIDSSMLINKQIPPWYYYDIRVLIINEGITSIAGFFGGKKFDKVQLPRTLTTIGAYAFGGSNLASIEIPHNVTTVGSLAFSGCNNLKDIIFHGAPVVASGAFDKCNNIQNIKFYGKPITVYKKTTTPVLGQIYIFYSSFPDGLITDAYYPTNMGWTVEDRVRIGEKWNWIPAGGVSDPENEPTEPETEPTEPPHNHSYKEVVTAPTCIEKGYTTYTCACGDSYIADYVDANHSWDSGVVTKEATERKEGEMTITCTVCGETKTEIIPKLPHTTHSGESTITPPTCTKDGYSSMICVDCGEEIFFEKIPAIGHTWDSGKVTKEPTEEAEGIKTYTCSGCGETKTEAVVKLPHTHKYTDTVTAPTCTEKGYTTHTCACGDKKVDTYIEATGHKWDNGKVTKEPTEKEEGIKTFTCSACKTTKTEKIAKLAHTHKYTDKVTAPTCTEKGYTTHTCACGDKKVDTYVEATGHKWDGGKVTKEPTEKEEGVKTFTCSACKTTKTEKIAKLAHTHKYTDKVTAPTCTEKGYTTHTCACGDKKVDTYVEATGHKWDSGKVTKEPTEEAEGVKTFTCSVCKKTKTSSIPKLDPKPAVTGTYTTDLVMPATDLGVSAPDAVLRATLTFGEDGKASTEWEAVDLTAFKVFFHDMFVNSYYAMAYGAGITDINEIEQFCIDSTGMSVSAYMDTIVTDEAMKRSFTPASTAGKYTCAQEQSVIYTDLPIMDVPSDPTVPNSFSVENGTLYLNAASYGKADYTFVCTKK